MKRIFPFNETVAFLTAFCGLVYELILGETLSALFGNTILRYSVTVGLYLLAMGIGSFVVEGRWKKNPARRLLSVEFLLSIVGGLSAMVLIAGASLRIPGSVTLLASHLTIIMIGLLVGMELPLLIYIDSEKSAHREHILLGWNYAGSFAGTVAFAFWLLPHVGIVGTALLAGLLNSAVGLMIGVRAEKIFEGSDAAIRRLLIMQGVTAAALILGLQNVSALTDILRTLYVAG